MEAGDHPITQMREMVCANLVVVVKMRRRHAAVMFFKLQDTVEQGLFSVSKRGWMGTALAQIGSKT